MYLTDTEAKMKELRYRKEVQQREVHTF